MTNVSAAWRTSKLSRAPTPRGTAISEMGAAKFQSSLRSPRHLSPRRDIRTPLNHSPTQAKFDQLAQWVEKHDHTIKLTRTAKREAAKAAADALFAAQNAKKPEELEKAALPPIPKAPVDIRKQKALVSQATTAIYGRFKDMYKAFQYLDVDGSGLVGVEELRRALEKWNIGSDNIEMLISACDKNGDGQISYNEFVDTLSRETVADAAMNKRGLQSKEAMGVGAFELLDQQLGHVKHNNVKMDLHAGGGVIPEHNLKTKDLINLTSTAMTSRFTDMFKAFQSLDSDRSGLIGEKELRRALVLWNIPVNNVDALVKACDQNGDGEISYDEFVDALARETVADAAMGKRGLQSKEAMGVDAQEMMIKQLGHEKPKNAMKWGDDI